MYTFRANVVFKKSGQLLRDEVELNTAIQSDTKTMTRAKAKELVKSKYPDLAAKYKGSEMKITSLCKCF